MTTLAGGPATGPATSFSVSATGIAIVGSTLFVGETEHAVVRQVDLVSGDATIYAGTGVSGSAGDGLPKQYAQVDPATLQIDGSGNLLVVDGRRIRRIDKITGVVTTVAGNGYSSPEGEGGPATSAGIDMMAAAVDSAGNLYVADSLNKVIRRIDAASGVITTVAGTYGQGGSSGDGGPATSARFLNPRWVVIDPAGDLFVNDGLSIRRIDGVTATISRIAGTGVQGYSGDGGPAVAAQLSNPGSLALDSSGGLLICDQDGSRIRRIDLTAGSIDTIAGNGSFDGPTGDGGPATAASLNCNQLALDGAGNLFTTGVAGVRRIDSATNVITTVVGNGVYDFSGDGGPATNAVLLPVAGAVDPAGNLFIYDYINKRVRRVDRATGDIETIAGRGGISNPDGDGGPALVAQLAGGPIAASSNGDLYLLETSGGPAVRKVDAASGIISDYAGNYSGGFSGDGGPAAAASLDNPHAIALDAAGNLFIAEMTRIRRVDAATGIITTIAGTGTNGFGGDGGPATLALFGDLEALALDASGNIFVSDYGNYRVRRIDAVTGIVDTVVGNGTGITFDGSDGEGGPATAASGEPLAHALAVAANGDLFVGQRLKRGRALRRVDATTQTISSLPLPSELSDPVHNQFFLGGQLGGDLVIVDPDSFRVRAMTVHSICGDDYVEPLGGEQCDDGGTTPGDGCSATCQIEPLTRSQLLAAGGTLSTDATSSGATASRPLQVAVTTPLAGTVSISASGATPSVTAGYEALGTTVQISAPVPPPGAPLEMVFTYDVSIAPLTLGLTDVNVYRDGAKVDDCVGAGLQAPQQVCVVSRARIAGDDVEIHILANHASLWESNGARCGDGRIGPSEECDDGNVVPGDGCDANCRVETCFVCRGTPSSCAPPSDTDGDLTCDGLDACTNVAGAQDLEVKASLKLAHVNTDPTAGNDTLAFSGVTQLAQGLPFAALNPAARGARILVRGATGAVVLDARLARGALVKGSLKGWKLNGKHSVWTYQDRSATPIGGITKATISDLGATGIHRERVGVKMSGKKATYPVSPPDLGLSVEVTLGDQGDAADGYCGQRTFDAAKCIFNAKKDTVTCKQ